MESINVVTTKLSKSDSSKVLLYLLAFIFTFHLTPFVYINSSFLEQFIGAGRVGLIFTTTSLITLLIFVFIYRFLNKFGNYNVFILAISLNFISLIILSLSLFFSSAIWSWIFILMFLLNSVTNSVAFMSLDIFLEHYSANSDTGGIRGIFLTSINFAFILGPLISGMIISDVSGAGKVYLLGALLLFPVLFISIMYLKGFKDAKYVDTDFVHSIAYVRKNKNLFNIFFVNFILKFFYTWMIIYMPIFLHNYIGFNLGEIATIIGIALVPFLLFQIPLGKIADKILGEKEILISGFLIMGISTILIAFFRVDYLWFWALLLFITRVGASAVEIMTETYFFKKVNDNNVNVIGLYSSISPLSYILSPVLASVLLIFFEINILFIVLGIIVLFGIYFSSRLKDTL